MTERVGGNNLFVALIDSESVAIASLWQLLTPTVGDNSLSQCITRSGIGSSSDQFGSLSDLSMHIHNSKLVPRIRIQIQDDFIALPFRDGIPKNSR